MEELHLMVEFQQHNPHYYMCKGCETQIASAEDFIFYHTLASDMTGGVFNKVVNVKVEDEPVRHKKIASHTFADVFCAKCNRILGFKYVEVDKNKALIQNGMVQLQMNMLWLRHMDKYFDAETMVPLLPPDYYMCKRCRNFVALAKDIDTYEFKFEPRIHRITFKKGVNVRVAYEPVHLLKCSTLTYARVYCTNCSNFLGCKHIASDNPPTVIQNGLVVLNIKLLLMRHGNNIVDHETMFPLPPNP